jgi:cell division protein FtsQ
MPRVKKPIPRPKPQDRPGRWQLMLRRQRRIFASAATGLVLLAVLLVGAGLLHTFAEGASLRERIGNATAALGLRIQQVHVDGRVKTPEALLRAAVGAAQGEPILTYSLADARSRIESLTWVQSATVQRQLPDTLLVKLVERSPFAVWQNEGKFRLIDRAGQIVTDSDVASFAKELPLVVGAGAPEAAAALLDALAAQPAIQPRVVAAVRVGERRWNLRMNSGADVMLPEGAEVAALQRLADLQAQHQVLERPLQVIDMRLPDRLVFRPQPQAAPETKDTPTAARRPT